MQTKRKTLLSRRGRNQGMTTTEMWSSHYGVERQGNGGSTGCSSCLTQSLFSFQVCLYRYVLGICLEQASERPYRGRECVFKREGMPIDVLSRAQAILTKFVSHISHTIDIGAKIVVYGRVKLVYQRRLPLWLADTNGRGPIEVVLSPPKFGAHSLETREDAAERSQERRTGIKGE